MKGDLALLSLLHDYFFWILGGGGALMLVLYIFLDVTQMRSERKKRKIIEEAVLNSQSRGKKDCQKE